MIDTKADNQDPALDAAFSQLASSTDSHVDVPGTRSVRATVSRRRTARRMAGLAVVVLVAAGIGAFALNRPSSDDTVGPDTANRGLDNRSAIERVDWKNSTLDMPALKGCPAERVVFKGGDSTDAENTWGLAFGPRGEHKPVFAELDKGESLDAVLWASCRNLTLESPDTHALIGVHLAVGDQPRVMGLIAEWAGDSNLDDVSFEVVDSVIKTETSYADRLPIERSSFSWNGSAFIKSAPDDSYVADDRWWNFKLDIPAHDGRPAESVTFRSGSSRVQTSEQGMPDPYWTVGGNVKGGNKRPAVDADLDGDGEPEVLLRLNYYAPNPIDLLLAVKVSDEGDVRAIGFIDIDFSATAGYQYVNKISVQDGVIKIQISSWDIPQLPDHWQMVYWDGSKFVTKK